MFKEKNVLVLGLARSGLASARALYKAGAFVTVTDQKDAKALEKWVTQVKPYVQELVLGGHPDEIAKFDYAVISPGIPVDSPYVKKLTSSGVHLIGEIELAYLVTDATFVGITGTNGKTTTTALLGEIFKTANRKHHVVGNIGIPAVEMAQDADPDSVLVTEVSSFQLETIEKWSCRVGALLNITPDHLNRHKTMENYTAAKMRVFENQLSSDWAVLNYDDPSVMAQSPKIQSQIAVFSRTPHAQIGSFIESGVFKIRLNNGVTSVCEVADMRIFGSHNESNALAAMLMASLCGIEVQDIKKALETFPGVAHRIEYVDSIEGRTFYNDSKATNPDAAICAIHAMKTPTVLIAGGMDKGSLFDEMIQTARGRVKTIVVYGETKTLIEEAATRNEFNSIHRVDTLDQAVSKAFAESEYGDAILLSPACASWDMYDDFEQRGNHFKSLVKTLKKVGGKR
ncbi:UDP-N-acetylmuramoyl-L-alanine--D-glutamate ligase [Fusibacter tunisiensis]|uniref:UDP-N-acetylmuramoylalanine--D-glutamate ligase n=1 Tax=Fusibacter tunisiensis TaxID=1008308 RepID=A0ABS2MM68_9FIRM|nr:UDP-N-acetylmuramoyl-L-alanine--D-glutamate ligase [Fusibacter tunisiensis]MBM7560498.1 UDP-N-acetylmuramoylalanine--D-glutamate ligase [Fusibacter tunisiensis]